MTVIDNIFISAYKSEKISEKINKYPESVR